MKTCSLDKLPIKQVGHIINLSSSDDLRRRMLDLGLVKGTSITPIFISPSGDPRAYEVRGCIVALRKEDARFYKSGVLINSTFKHIYLF